MMSRYRMAGLLLTAMAAGMPAVILYGCGRKPSPPQVGVLMLDESRQPILDGLKEGLRQLGREVNVDLRFVVRNAEDDQTRLVPLAEELAALRPKVICALGSAEAVAAVPLAQSTGVAVVYLGVGNPEALGIAESKVDPLPGTTGIRTGYADRLPKRMQLATYFFPDVRVITVLYDPQTPASAKGMKLCEETGPKLGLIVQSIALTSDADVRYFAETMVPGKYQLLMYTPAPLLIKHLRNIIAPAAIRAYVPIFGLNRQACSAGAVISFGPTDYGFGVQGAHFVHGILLGTAPETMPIETPEGSQLELCLNMKVAQKIGVVFPPRMFELADLIIR